MHCRRWFCCCEGRKYSIVAWFLIDKNRVYKSAIAWCLCIVPCCDYLRVNILPYLEKLTLNRNRVNYRKLNFWTCNAVWTKNCLKLDLLQVRMSLDLSSMSVLAFENFKAFFKPNAFPASTGRRGGPPCSLLRLLVLRGNAKNWQLSEWGQDVLLPYKSILFGDFTLPVNFESNCLWWGFLASYSYWLVLCCEMAVKYSYFYLWSCYLLSVLFLLTENAV